jgi:hypothetical protein
LLRIDAGDDGDYEVKGKRLKIVVEVELTSCGKSVILLRMRELTNSLCHSERSEESLVFLKVTRPFTSFRVT